MITYRPNRDNAMFGAHRNALDCAIIELCNKWTILQRDYRKMTISWSFSYNSLVKFHVKKNIGATTLPCYIHILVIMRCVIKGLCCIFLISPS